MSKDSNYNKLLDGPMGSVLARMSAAMMIGMLGVEAFNITDTFFVSRLGTLPLAAMSFTFPVVMVVGGLATGIGVGASAVLSRLLGKGEKEEVRLMTTSALLLGLILVAMLVLLGLATIRPLFTLLGASAETLPLIEQYMSIWYVGVMFLVIPMIGNNAMRATGDTLSPSIIMIADVSLNIILDPIFIFGWGSFPAMGIEGAALATVLSRALAMAVSLYILGAKKKMIHIGIPEFTYLKYAWKTILKLAVPVAAARMLMPLAWGALMRMVAWNGTAVVAGFGTAMRIEHMFVIPIMSVGMSLVPFVGQNLGAGNFSRIELAGRWTSLFSVLWGIACALLLFVAAEPVAGIFSTDPAVIEALTLILYISPISYGFKGLGGIASNSMNGLGLSLSSLMIMILRFFALILPLSFVGVKLYGFTGLLVGLASAEVITGIVSVKWSDVVTQRLFIKTRLENEAVVALNPAG